MPFVIPTWWNWKVTYSLILLLLFLLTLLYVSPNSAGSGTSLSHHSPAILSCIIWGVVSLVLSMIFMLGAAQTPIQFLVFFATGAFGAAMGYLVGAWLTPNADSNPLDQVRNIVAGVLTGVVGTKLLSLWDDLVDKPAGGGKPPILTTAYFVPIVLWLFGFTVSLSAFYTVRTEESGSVRMTYLPVNVAFPLGDRQIGLLPGSELEFAAAANSPVDITVSWDFSMQKPCGAGSNTVVMQVMSKAFDATTGKLTAPSESDLKNSIDTCPGSTNWILTATSKQDKSKSASYNVKYCRSAEECVAPPSAPKATPKQTPSPSTTKSKG